MPDPLDGLYEPTYNAIVDFTLDEDVDLSLTQIEKLAEAIISAQHPTIENAGEASHLGYTAVILSAEGNLWEAGFPGPPPKWGEAGSATIVDAEDIAFPARLIFRGTKVSW